MNKKNVRRCCVCHKHDDREKLIRFVRTKDGGVTLDESGHADGRGAYVHDNEECIARLKRKKLLSAAFKTKVDDSVYDLLGGR